MSSTADLEIRNAPFPEKVSSDKRFALGKNTAVFLALGILMVPIWILLAFALEHNLLSTQMF